MQRLSGHPFEPWLLERIAAARHLVLMTHVGPDADGLGCEVAFCAAARAAGREVHVINEDSLPARYRWLDPRHALGHVDRDAGFLAAADLGLCFDAHEVARVGKPAAELRRHGVDVWVVDHHPVGPDVDVQGVIAPEFSSSGELVYHLIRALGWRVDAEVARPLYAAMSFDTGSFRFLRNQPETLHVAAALLETGIDTNPIQEALFASRPRSEWELLGRVIQHTRFAADGQIAWLAADASFVQGLDIAPDAIGETISQLVGIEGVLVAMMLKPDREPGLWKLSLRSKTAVKIGDVARRRGGGGHDHAAGATIAGELPALTAELVAEIEAIVRAAQSRSTHAGTPAQHLPG